MRVVLSNLHRRFTLSYTSVFLRYELKYLLARDQLDAVRRGIEPYMMLDSYGRTTIRNVYYDTDSYRLIRRSNEKPAYKEKLRIRSYRQATAEDFVFVELKKKFEGVVYKRRIALPESVATDWLGDRIVCPQDSQISREIDYFKQFYGGLSPMMFLSYEREAFYEKDGGDLRITFDDNILCRRTDISLCSDTYGHSLLPSDRVLMEIKCPGAIPLWMVDILSREKIYKTSFSKYGTAYTETVLPELTHSNNCQKEIKSNA